MSAQTSSASNVPVIVSQPSRDRDRVAGIVGLLTRTKADVAPLLARLVLGAVMFPHGAQKALGWFGGYGFGGTMSAFTGQMGIPTAFAVLAIAAEFLGSIGLLFGVLSRVAAFGIAANMAVAVLLVHGQFGFFMNWFGKQSGEGFEYHLLALALAAIVVIKGAGAYSLDHLLGRLGSRASATSEET